MGRDWQLAVGACARGMGGGVGWGCASSTEGPPHLDCGWLRSGDGVGKGHRTLMLGSNRKPLSLLSSKGTVAPGAPMNIWCLQIGWTDGAVVRVGCPAYVPGSGVASDVPGSGVASGLAGLAHKHKIQCDGPRPVRPWACREPETVVSVRRCACGCVLVL